MFEVFLNPGQSRPIRYACAFAGSVIIDNGRALSVFAIDGLATFTFRFFAALRRPGTRAVVFFFAFIASACFVLAALDANNISPNMQHIWRSLNTAMSANSCVMIDFRLQKQAASFLQFDACNAPLGFPKTRFLFL